MVSSFGIKQIFNLRKEFNFYKMFFVHKHGRWFIVLYTNMATVTSCENDLYIICSLLVGVFCVADKSKLEWKLSLSQFSLQDARNHILRLWNFKIFWVTTPPDPNKKGDERVLVGTVTVGFSVQSCWLRQFLLKPLRWSTYRIEFTL